MLCQREHTDKTTKVEEPNADRQAVCTMEGKVVLSGFKEEELKGSKGATCGYWKRVGGVSQTFVKVLHLSLLVPKSSYHSLRFSY